MSSLRKTFNGTGIFCLGLALVYIAPFIVNSATYLMSPAKSNPTKFASKWEDLGTQYRAGCPNHQFRWIQRLSRNPNVIIIDGFLTSDEASFLINAA